MPRWERIGRIHDLLEEGAYPNATRLGRQLKLTTKTIHRDVAYMREHLGLPIAFDKQRLGYYYDQAVPCQPTQPMSDAELFGLLVAHRVVAQHTGTEMESSLRATMEKFLPQLDTCACLVVEDMREVMSHLPSKAEPASLALHQKLWRALRGDDHSGNGNNSFAA
jgi:proteasome accessory factor B